MLIPRMSYPVAYVLRAASEGKSAVERPAIIVCVNTYDVGRADVNLQVFTNGDADVQFFGNQSSANLVHVAGAQYDADGKEAGTFRYLDEKAMSGPRIETIRVTADITHGRETVRKDATGVWDQLRNTLAFPREFIEGMHPDHLPEYAADQFVDWHVARLMMPKGYVVSASPAPMDGKERPHERQEYMEDLMDEWSNSEWGTPWPSSVRRQWERGAMRQRAIEQRKNLMEGGDRLTRPRTPMIPTETPAAADEKGGERQVRELANA